VFVSLRPFLIDEGGLCRTRIISIPTSQCLYLHLLKSMLNTHSQFTSLFVRCTLFVVLAVAGLSSTVCAQENWPRFRGENGQGVAACETIPVSWTADDYNWRIELPAGGNSSPVVWQNKIFLMCADAKSAERFVVCIDANNGDLLWSKSFASQTHKLHARNTFASCTPAVDEQHVYVGWSTPEHTLLKAFSHEGEEVWSKDLGPWVSQHGFGVSPIVYEGKVILSNSQQSEQLDPDQKPGVSSMIALDCKTGEEIWKTPRKSAVASYSVPCIFRGAQGQDQLICCSTADGMYSLNPQTGKPNWSVTDAFEMRTVASPVFAGDLIFASTGSGGGGNYIVAVQADAQPKIVYRIKESANYVPTPVVLGDYLFTWFDKGVVSCIETKTGEAVWRERVAGEFSGSPIIAHDRMYCISDDGKVFVVAANREFKLLAVNPLGEPSRSTPAIAGGRMFLRTDKHLISVGG
jgi:outer membrane protein assembly factor BamB